MRRILAVTALVALMAAACGAGPTVVDTIDPGATDPSGEPTGTAEPTGTGQPTDEPTGEPTDDRTMTYEQWFTYGDKLFVTHRTEPFDQGVGAASMRALMSGPTQAEVAAGVGTAIPSGSSFRSLDIDGGTATVDLSGEFESGGGSLSMAMRLAQVVYTLTQFESVERVSFLIDGEPVPVFSGEGIVLDGPVTRNDYLDVFPNVLVTRPGIGARLDSPFDVVGMANTFEATVYLSLVDADGNELATAYTTATCGTGCWGDYAFDGVTFDVSEETAATLVIEEDDPSGGENPNGPFTVRIPVTLVP